MPTPAAPGCYPIESVGCEESFAALQPEWDELLADSQANPLTLSHLWLFNWWQVFGSDRRLHLLLARESSGRLVGIAPLLRRVVRYRGLVPFRRVEFLATGEHEADEIDSDYLDLILRKGYEEPVREALLRHLLENDRAEWDELLLGGLPEESATIGACESVALDCGRPCRVVARLPGVQVRLAPTWDEFLRTLSKKTRHNVRRIRRRLEEHGEVSFRITQNRSEFEELWPKLVELHQRRWLAVGKPGCFASPLFTKFHERVGPLLAEQGRARLAVLAVKGRVLAARYFFMDRGILFAYQSGWDPTVDAQLGAMTALIGYLMEAAIQHGCRTFDFLKGIAPHKLSWSEDVHHQVTVRVGRSGWREWTRNGLEWVVARTRNLRRRSHPSVGEDPARPPREGARSFECPHAG